ncbi:MAG: glycosyltransferase family 2 protein [Clostridia bacterium]|nr:glycosyltransferase family 2 protein [Clostridia bacterium]
MDTNEITQKDTTAELDATVKVSVVMPIYNAVEYLTEAIDCVLGQTLSEIELICVDDGSTDGSFELIKERQANDKRVRIITENNAGPSAARNKGLARARGEYVIFLDADDFFEPTLLEKLYGLATKKNLDIAVAKYDLYNNATEKFAPPIESEHGELLDGRRVISKRDNPDKIFQTMTCYVWNKLFKRSFLVEKNIQFHPELYVFEDVYFVCAALSLAERVGKENCVLVHHRIYSEQSRAKLFRKYYAQVPVVYEKLLEFLKSDGMYLPLKRSYLNLSASRCYKIYNLLWQEVKGEFYDMYHEKYAEAFGWAKAVPEEIESPEVRDFVANVLLHNHEQYLDRVAKGLAINPDRIPEMVRKKRKRDRFKGFFARIFKKKEK